MKNWKVYIRNLGIRKKEFWVKSKALSPRTLALKGMYPALLGREEGHCFRKQEAALELSRSNLVLTIIQPLLQKEENLKYSDFGKVSWPVFFFLLLCHLPMNVTKACGPIMDDFEGYSFLMPELLEPASSNVPFLTDFSDFYKDYVGAAEAQAQGNIEEWVDVFCQSAKGNDIAKVIYGLSVEDMRVLRTAIQSKSMRLTPILSKNTFAKHLKRHKCTETIDYLIFAKRCEPHVTAEEDAWEAPSRNVAEMKNLIEEIRPKLNTIKSNYIRLRYVYQLVRLAHYAGNYREVLVLYDELMAQVRPVDSILHFWIMGHRAGALYKLNERVEAAYLFSKIFMYCDSKKESAFLSFYIETDEEWDACYNLCETDEERANLYSLRAHSDESKAVEEMIRIYDLNPQNQNLEILLVNEIKKLEKDLLGLSFNDKKRTNAKVYKLPRREVGEYVISLRALANKCAEEKKVLRPNLWKMAEGYLEFLSGDHYAATRTFEKLAPKVKNPVVKEQLEAWQLALEIATYEDVDEETEGEIADIIRDNKQYKKFNDFPDYLNDKLSFDYAKNGRPGKAFRMQYILGDLKANPQMEIVDDLLKVCKQEKLSRLERALITKKSGGTIEDDLLDMRGTVFLMLEQPEAALEALSNQPRGQWDNVALYPFRDSLNDCVYCKPRDSSSYYNKISLLEKIFELEYKAKADFHNSATYFYKLGLAHYNMTYFGSAWKAKDYYRSGANWEYSRDHIFQKAYFPYGNREFQDCSKALFYFDKAIELSADRELAARACFMAARCEQKRYFISKDCDYSIYGNNIPSLPELYMSHYNLLMTEYAESSFYQLAIEECSFFAAYARR